MDKFEHVPLGLTSLPRWIVWKEELRHGKPNKTPYSMNGVEAKTDSPETWTTCDEIQKYDRDKYDGPGFVLGDGLFGIDLDSCIKTDGSLMAWAEEVLRLCPSYCEISPSGVGLKIIGFGKAPAPEGKTGKTFRKLTAAHKNKAPEIAVWNERRYFTITGNVFREFTDLVDCQQGLTALWKRLFEKKPAQSHQTSSTTNCAVGKVVEAMSRMSMQDGNDGSRRLFAACCRAVEHDLSDHDAISAIRSYGHIQPFPVDWSDTDIVARIRDAENETQRGEALNVQPKAFRQIEPTKEAEQEFDTLYNITGQYIDDIGKNKNPLIDTGLPDLDYAIGGGIEMGEVVVVAGRPSHGKTALALQMIHAMTYAGLPCLYVNEEMTDSAMGKRVVQFASNVSEPAWTQHKQSVTKHVAGHFSLRADCFVANHLRTSANVEAVMRRAVESHEVKVVVIDYLQRIRGKGKGRYEDVTEVSETLSGVGKELGIVTIMLCQLNRNIESRTDSKIPKMCDLRESGQIEQDADVILFAVWPVRLNPQHPNQSDYTIHAAKNRNRAINNPIINCEFDPLRQKVIESQIRVQHDPAIAAFNQHTFDPEDSETF